MKQTNVSPRLWQHQQASARLLQSGDAHRMQHIVRQWQTALWLEDSKAPPPPLQPQLRLQGWPAGNHIAMDTHDHLSTFNISRNGKWTRNKVSNTSTTTNSITHLPTERWASTCYVTTLLAKEKRRAEAGSATRRVFGRTEYTHGCQCIKSNLGTQVEDLHSLVTLCR